jgi:aspartyl-tRNA(Asn)/glutamyl-tRNA(Gln) amidotransferase subunit B
MRSIGLTRIHMEETRAKNIHDAVAGGGVTHVDRTALARRCARSSEPRSAREEAGAYLRSLRQVLRYPMSPTPTWRRASSVTPTSVPRDAALGTRTGFKNEPSASSSARSARSSARSSDRVRGRPGGEMTTGTTAPSSAMRSKEHADDYRYFPDPDLPPLKLDADWPEKQRAALPELPLARRARYRASYGLPDYDAEVLTDDRDVSEFFEAVVKSYDQPKTVSNWVMRDVLAAATEAGKPLRGCAHPRCRQLLKLVDAGRITAGRARVFAEIATGERAEDDRARAGLERSPTRASSGHARGDRGEQRSGREIQAGETKLLNFFVGQVMKRTGGKADPARLREVLARLLAV